MRLGANQLRNRVEIRNNWQDVRDVIGDAFTDALGCIHYKDPHNRLQSRLLAGSWTLAAT
ncbi:hypothetical protein DL239_19905 [Sedimentitalea sp. CY04]|uniref:Uncharacterized protein n=1 Tax=Parasedimentitalea denitrificans TaxID=2211118 RepID=A0ABX0WC03_9RHOB|nr:hypothetical protein [Sedimentitalea sp. CY04]